MSEEIKHLTGSAYILNPIANINGHLTEASQIYDANQGKNQSEINELITLSSGVSEIQEFYAVYSAPKYEGGDMKEDPNVHWVQVPSPSGEEFPAMTPKNPYLWNYEKFIQTNKTIISTEPHVAGVLGRGYKSITRLYLVDNQSDKAPAADDPRWATQSPPTTEENKFLWEKQEIYYSDNYDEANPDETIFTLIGVKGEKGIDGTEIEYIFCFWPSKTSGPINPTPDDWETNKDYQTESDYIPSFIYSEDSEIKDGYSWSDDPVSVSKENPAQWICCREKKDGKWGEFSDPKLYSTYGEDGVSIETIETWYLISNTNILNDDIKGAENGENPKEPVPNKWYKNSPAVNKDYRYLWKKTKLTFSADIYDNPDTEITENKTTTSISYEVIGSMGDKGIDGDSVEWIYTKTKTNDKPELNSSKIDNTITDKNYSDYNKPDYIPYPRKEDFEKGLSEYYWSDDIQAVDKDYIYGWRSQRKKTNEEWKNFSEPVLILEKAIDGVSPNAAFKSIVFCRSTQKPAIDSEKKEGFNFNTYDNPIPPVSEKGGIKFTWSDGIPEGNEPLWSSTRIFSSDGKSPQQDTWTDPEVMSDTLDVKFIYSSKQDQPALSGPFTGNSDWFDNNPHWTDEPDESGNSIWMAVSNRVNNVWSGWIVSKIKGERGDDGTSIKVSGHYKTSGDFKTDWQKDDKTWIDPSQGPATDDYIEKKPYSSDSCFIVEGKLWVWDGSDEWIDAGQFTGDPGKTIYFHVIYTNSIDDLTIKLTENNIPGKYIATFSSEFQSLSDAIIKEENGTVIVKTVNGDRLLKDLQWTKWTGDDGYGYEYIYKLTKEDQSVDLPSVPGDWDTNENYQKPDLVPSDWSDNPLSVSKEFPYCWQAYRMRVDGIWQPWNGHSDTLYAALWSKFGKDGLTLFSKSWYCIAKQNATKDDVQDYPIPTKNTNGKWEVEVDGVKKEIAEGTAEYWWENSPMVTDAYPNLWKRTESEYKESNIDGSFGIDSQKVYELIGSKGAKGVDGNDIQWAFKLTKSFETPTSIIEGNNWPKDDINNQTAGEWTDDALDVSQEYPYQWVIKRSKIDGVWTDWGTKVIGEDNQYYYKATLNNSFGNYITTVKSYYIVSNENEIGGITPNKSEYTSHEEYEDDLINKYGWTVGSGETLTTSLVKDKLYELSIYIFSDKTYSISGPIIKAQWLGDNIQSTVFCRSNSTPGRPEGGSYNDPYPTNDDGSRDLTWSDGIPDRYIKDEKGNITDTLPSTVWSSTAVFKTTDTDIENGPTGGWSEPIQLTDTSSLRIRYCNLENLPTDDNDNIIYPEEADSEYWTSKPSEDTVWMATQYFSYGEWNDWEILKVKGETGKDGAKPNLFLNSGFDNEEDPFKYWIVDVKEDTDLSALLVEKAGEQGVNGINGRYDLSYDITDQIIPGEIYTISFRLSFMNKNSVKIDLSELISSWDDLLSFSSESLSGSENEENLFLSPNKDQFVNKKVFFTFKTPETLGTNEKLKFKLVSNNSDGYTTHSLKLENSPYVTDYCRAQEDLKGKDGKDSQTAKPNLFRNTNFDVVDSKKGLLYYNYTNGVNIIPEGFNSYNVASKSLAGRSLEQVITLEPGKSYTLSGYAKNNHIEGELYDTQCSGWLIQKASTGTEDKDYIHKEELNFGLHEDGKKRNGVFYTFWRGSSAVTDSIGKRGTPNLIFGPTFEWEFKTITFKYNGTIKKDVIITTLYQWSQHDTNTGEGTTQSSSYIAAFKLEESEVVTPYVKHIDDYSPVLKSTVFIRNSNTPDTPTGGDYNNPVPTDWSDGIPEGNGRIWSSTNTFYAGGLNTGWSTPQMMSDNSDLKVYYSIKESPGELPESPNINEDWTTTASSAAIWMATSSREAGSDTWSEWTITKIKGEDGINGESAVYADLDNEMDSIPLTSGGYASSLTPVKTIVWISKGINKQEISYLKVKVGDDEYVYKDKEPESENTTTSTTTPTPTENETWYILGCTDKEDYSYEFTITPKDTNTKIPEKTEFNIILGYYENLKFKSFNLYFTVNGIKPGADGKSAVAYKLIPSVNSIIRKKDNGGFIPQTITFYGQKNIGGDITNVRTGSNAIAYHLNGTGGHQELSFVDTEKENNKLELTTDKFPEDIKSIRFAWRINNVDVDVETISILKEGEDGLSPEPNLLINSNFDLYDEKNKLKGWTNESSSSISIKEKEYNGFNAVYKSSSSQVTFLITTTPVLESGTYYTFSFYYKSSVQTTVILRRSSETDYVVGEKTDIKSSDNSNVFSTTNKDINCNFNPSSEWRKAFITFKTKSKESIGLRFYYNPGGTTPAEIYISQPKLELGEYSTPYTKNQNDLIGPVGPAGKSGRNMYPAGNWDETVEYKIENNSVPFVFYSQNYYILTVGEEEIVTGKRPDKHPDKWGIFEYTPFQFSEFLMANWAKFGGTNGAVFYDRYLYSQKGYTSDKADAYYWDYKDEMFGIDDSGNPYLTDKFTPKLHLDFYNGLANLSCLCEPYITPQEEENEPGVIRISPENGFNIKIPCNCPSSGSDGGIAPPMLHPIVVLPSLDDVNQSKWAFDGAHVTILFEPGGQKYGALSGPYSSRIDKQNVFLLICTDLSTSPTGKGIGIPNSTYDQNLIFCNNKRGKYIILSPGSMVKLKVNVVKNDNGTKYLHWIIENSGAIKEESVNIYNTNKPSLNKPTQIEDSIVPGNISLDGKDDSVVQFYGADYPDYVNLATTTLPNAWGLMFYSGPDGFCPKNILFSRQLDNNQRLEDDAHRYHYRVLDFIGKEGSYGSTLNPPDQANNFTVSPLI